MTELVAALAVSHVPGHTVNPNLVPLEQKDRIDQAWANLRAELLAAKPDIVIAISNDHAQNFFPVQPQFCVGTGDVYSMPHASRAQRLKLEPIEVQGHPDFADHLIATADDLGFPLAFSDHLILSDEISIPQRFLDPDNCWAWLPILTNCLNRNQPSPRTFFALGSVIAKAINRYPGSLRIAIVATGGLSHDPLGPNWCLIDESFDRRFLHLLELGDTDALFAEFTLADILKPGKGGTPEMLNWFVGLGAVADARAIVHCYEPVPAWATGVGYTSWPVVQTDATT